MNLVFGNRPIVSRIMYFFLLYNDLFIHCSSRIRGVNVIAPVQSGVTFLFPSKCFSSYRFHLHRRRLSRSCITTFLFLISLLKPNFNKTGSCNLKGKSEAFCLSSKQTSFSDDKYGGCRFCNAIFNEFFLLKAVFYMTKFFCNVLFDAH